MGVKVLSLFDGMACGMLAMQKAGVDVEEYTAYEVDKYAIKTATHNFPMIKECGDVFAADFTQYKDIDYIVGGSPCTYWSIAQKNNRETEASGLGWELFSQYVRAIREVKPKFFIYENNKSMSNAIRESITKTFGFEPICINSALVSAQNRQRLYWVGKRNADGTYSKVDVKQPEDRGILLKDVLDNPIRFSRRDGLYECKDKALAICSSDWRGINRNQLQNAIVEPVCVQEQVYGRKAQDDGSYDRRYEARNDSKSGTLTSTMRQNAIAEPVNITNEGKSQTIKAQYQQSSIANFCKYTSTYGATGVAEPVNTTIGGKAQCLRATYYKDGVRNIVGNNIDKKTGVAELIRVGALPRPNGELSTSQAMRVYSTEDKSVNLISGGGGMGGKTGLYAVPIKVGEVGNGGQGNRIYSIEGKSVSQTATSGGVGSNTGLYAIPVEFENDKPIKATSCVDGKTYTVYEVKDGLITIKSKQYPIKLIDGYYIIRKLTVSECKRLQTVPEWYEFPVSDTQAYKMLGNGWTVDVIAHLIKATLNNT